MGHSGRGRGALPAQSRVAGLAGRQRPAAPVSASAHRNAGAKLARRTLQPCHAAPAGTVAYAEGIPSPLFGSQTPATAARAGGTAPAGRSGDDSERAFWQHWDGELRDHLARLSASQSSLWGRLLLQTAGSSPAAWRKALEKFPDAEAARAWREQSPLETSWRRKCELIPPLTRVEGGAVIFTQFLETQAALADFLRGAGVDTFVINGATPAPERQPITEEFGRRGGALLLTH